jgi:hypothetical protein
LFINVLSFLPLNFSVAFFMKASCFKVVNYNLWVIFSFATNTCVV